MLIASDDPRLLIRQETLFDETRSGGRDSIFAGNDPSLSDITRRKKDSRPRAFKLRYIRG